MENTNTNTQSVLEELHVLLRELSAHAHAGGRTVEGDAFGYLKDVSGRLSHLAHVLGADANAVVHSAFVRRLEELEKRMVEEVEDDEWLKSFWEQMVEEIPDMIEGVEAFLEKGEEVALASAEVIEDAATAL